MANKTFTVKAPNGQTVTVLAPENASDEEIIARAQRQASASVDMTAGVMGPQAQPEAPKARSQYRPENDGGILNGVRDFAGTMTDWGLFSFGDELAGAGTAIGGSLNRLASGQGIDTSTISEDYTEGKEKFKQDQADFQEDSPYLYGTAAGLGLVGSAAGGALLAPRAAAGLNTLAQGTGITARAAQAVNPVVRAASFTPQAGLARNIGAAGLQGAGYGFVGGVGATDGDLGDVFQGGLTGAGIGAVLGPAVTTGVSVASKTPFVFNLLTKKGRERLGNQAAARELNDLNEAAGRTFDDAADEMAYRQQELGVPAIMADTNDIYRQGLVRQMGRVDDANAGTILDRLGTRQRGAGARARGYLARDLGTPVDPEAHRLDLQNLREQMTGPAYKAFLEETPEYGRDLSRWLRNHPKGNEALFAGLRAVRNEDQSDLPRRLVGMVKGKRWKEAQPARPDRWSPVGELDSSVPVPGRIPDNYRIENGTVYKLIPGRPAQPGRMVDARVPGPQVISRANTYLNRRAEYGNRWNAEPISADDALAYKKTGDEFRRRFDEVFKNFETARESNRIPVQLRAAFDEGTKATGLTPERLTAIMSKMDDDQADQFIKGFIVALNDASRKKGGLYGDATKALVGTDEKIGQLFAAFGKAKGNVNLQRFIESLDAEKSAMDTYRRTLARRTGAASQGIDDVNALTAGGRAAIQGAAGLTGSSLSNLLRFVGDTASKAISKQKNRILAEALSTNDVATVRRIMQESKVSLENQQKVLEKIATARRTPNPVIGNLAAQGPALDPGDQ